MQSRSLALLGMTTVVMTARAQAPVSTGAFIVRLGRDTIAVEAVPRPATRLEGDLVRRSPTTTVVHYVIDTDAGGNVASARLEVRKPDGMVLRSIPSVPITAPA